MKKKYIIMRLLMWMMIMSSGHHLFSQSNANPFGKYIEIRDESDSIVFVNSSAVHLSFSSFTIEFWLNVKELAHNKTYIIARNEENPWASRTYWGVYLDKIPSDTSIARLGFELTQGSPLEGDTIQLDEWYHVAVVYDFVGFGATNTAQFFINGNPGANGNISTILFSFNEVPRVFIGNDGLYPEGTYLNGDIDEVRIWNVARTATEIADNSCIPLDGTESPNLVALWKFDEPEITDPILDSSPSGLNADPSNNRIDFTPAHSFPTCSGLLARSSVTPFVFELDTYPNPFVTNTTIRLKSETDEKVIIEVIDISGKKVATLHDGPIVADKNYSLLFDPEMKVEGIYVVRLTSNGKVYERKIVMKP